MNKGRKTTNVKTSLNDVIRTTTSNRHPPTERQPLFDYSAISTLFATQPRTCTCIRSSEARSSNCRVCCSH